MLPHDPAVAEADRAGTAVVTVPDAVQAEIDRVITFLEGVLVA